MTLSAALLRAAVTRDSAVIEAALRAGAPVDARDRDGRALLHHAAIEGDVPVAKLLLDAGADVNARDRHGWSPLHFAAQEFRVDVAMLLLACGAVADAVDENGNTPLWRAVFASEGRGEMVKLLLDNGADRNLKNLHGVSPLELARTIANVDVRRCLE